MAPRKSKKKASLRSLKSEDALHKIPLRITDTTLRDAHQSLWATRMRTKDIMGIIDTVDQVGYYSLEVWGGATFDVCMRFLREDPWERLRLMKKAAKKTPLQMLLRGQNLVGYKNYADDVVDRFVELAHSNGVDIFRIFDALNDTRNLEAAIKAVKKHGAHAQGTLSYTISPVHTVEKYVQHAKDQVALGIDSLCIKDMAGILTPIAAENLVGALVEEVGIPIQLHCHATSGMGTATYVEAVRTGAGAIDCAISSMAGFTAQPPVEALAAIFDESHYSPNLDADAMAKVAKYFTKIAPKRRQNHDPLEVIDPGILQHQIPGGMISNFKSQLSAQGALDKLDEALEEVQLVRKDLGYPPLVTPTSQIVGTQAVMNVITGERYKAVPNEIKEYVRGMYGRTPAPIKKKFQKSIIGDEKPINYRPGDKIEPMLPSASDGLDPDLVEKDEDIISYIMHPEPAIAFFKWRKQPEDAKDPIPADLEEAANAPAESVSAAPAAKSTSASKPVLKASSSPAEMHPDQMLHIEDYKGLGHIINQAAGISISELVIRKGDFSLGLSSTGSVSSAMNSAASASTEVKEINAAPASVSEESIPTEEEEVVEEEVSASVEEYANTVKAPLGGTFYKSSAPGKPELCKVGDILKKGDKVCIVEAMKLFNEIEAPEDCKITAILLSDGEAVEKDQPLIAYDPA